MPKPIVFLIAFALGFVIAAGIALQLPVTRVIVGTVVESPEDQFLDQLLQGPPPPQPHDLPSREY